MINGPLTERNYWDHYWQKISLPLEIKKSKQSLYLNELLKIFDRYLPRDERLSILEIGGSPGQYLAYIYRNFNYDVHCLDYSDIGCLKTKENFERLKIPGTVHQQDIFDDVHHLPLFDIVYSLGFIEHFSDLNRIIGCHLKFLKPKGILIIGCPNFLGINGWFLKRLAPDLLSKHNLSTMNIADWSSFKNDFCLTTLFKGYIGGFEPGIFKRYEKKTFSTRILKNFSKILYDIFHSHFRVLRKFNSKYISGYAMGVYQKQ